MRVVYAGRGHHTDDLDQKSRTQPRVYTTTFIGMNKWSGVSTIASQLTIIVMLAFALLAIRAWFLVFMCVVLSKADLHLAGDNTFHLSVFSDLHYGENESTFGIPADKNSAALMTQVLAQEQPNFVVLNGDLITGENTFAFNSTGYVDQIVAPLVAGRYNWASTYGNHDSKYNLSREALYAKEKTYGSAYTQHGPAGTDGVTNYVLPVFPQNTTDPYPAALLWFFDSRGGSSYQSEPENVDNIDNYVSKGTVAWFRSTQSSIEVRLDFFLSTASLSPLSISSPDTPLSCSAIMPHSLYLIRANTASSPP